MHDLAETFVVSFAPSIFWLGYLYYGGRYRRRGANLLVVAYLAGIVAGPVALATFEALETVPFYARLTDVYNLDDEAVRFAYCVFAIGPVEELAKFLLVWATTYRRPEFARPLDGLMLAAAGALGFASVENWYYMREVEVVVWARAITLPFNHMLFSSFWGVGIAYAKFPRLGGANLVLYLGLFLSFVFHGLYDYVLLSPQVPDLAVLVLVAILWFWLTRATHWLRDLPDRLGGRRHVASEHVSRP